MRIYLVPEAHAMPRWESALPEHFLIADLKTQRPTHYSNGRFSELPLGATIEFAIYGVTPGTYRVQALWDKRAPFCNSTNQVCDPTPGDFISTTSPLVKVGSGKVSASISIDCNTIVK